MALTNPKDRNGEKGASLIILALGLVALLAMLALAVDGGYAFSMRRRMQIAADAAALSGARVLAIALRPVRSPAPVLVRESVSCGAC